MFFIKYLNDENETKYDKASHAQIKEVSEWSGVFFLANMHIDISADCERVPHCVAPTYLC